jgi:hypothetical protein
MFELPGSNCQIDLNIFEYFLCGAKQAFRFYFNKEDRWGRLLYVCGFEVTHYGVSF